MKQPKRLTRADKIAAAREAAVAPPISDPALLATLPPGTYTVTGAAADEVNRQALANTLRHYSR